MQGGSREVSVWGYISEVELEADGFYMGGRIKDDAAIFGLSHWVDDGALSETRKKAKELRIMYIWGVGG